MFSQSLYCRQLSGRPWNGGTNEEMREEKRDSDAKHSKPRPVPHCRVLPPGEFNDMTPATIACPFQKFHHNDSLTF